MKVSSIDCRRLRKIIRKECGSCLIVDCRPYFSFSSSSIRGSVNVNLNSVVVRRSRGGPVPLQFIIPDEKALFRLREGSISAVVALDDRTPHLQKLKKDSIAQIVINSLAHLASSASICFLKGGYENFHSHYPELCTETKSVDLSEDKSERGVSSHCDKLGSHHKPDYDQGRPVEILPFLYLGSAYHACRQDYLSDLRITALLNVSRRDSRPAKGLYDYKWIPVEDSCSRLLYQSGLKFDLSVFLVTHAVISRAFVMNSCTFLSTERVKAEGGKVLVHCEAGISRSPTICMAYIMKTQRLRLEQAFDVIRQRRAIISPNFSFMGQLLQFESEVVSSTPPSATPAAQETPTFFSGDFTLETENFESSVFTFPTSFLTPMPIQSSVHQFKLSPITALP
ncbi:dual specificity protein phosphatase 5-like [Sinocyclocheilus rhinocerous]|uniref:dual specificity protein phosphatase 5-like n=1 Tax=Sinocyclocheilus rhinocerous TaxID=307959 RepID=UPI0007B86906|nr:PREDICTED: dual specificity protein phosphatase 5-like [Sinocyclocheilus rhinocerous]